ncbi:MAG: SPOR domain-containing protein [Gammaproteobacteria bacterium]|nr:SPOR domain-containing protein [Gammaproteobacteria bacterium]MDH5614400.1 SPOR domain-containing protein [Gammaproteobacteria bacterium]
MKWLFGVLVILNIAFFVWQINYESEVEIDLSKLPPIQGENLVLLSEVENLSSRKKRPNRPDGREMPAACYALSSFPNLEDAEKMAAVFRESGIDAEERVGEEKDKLGYLVFLPSTGSLDEARRSIEDLKKKKIEDYAIVTVDGIENTVVLGLYQTRPAVDRRTAELKELGYDISVIEHFRKRAIYLVEFEEKVQHSVPPELWQKLSNEYPDVMRSRVPCP